MKTHISKKAISRIAVDYAIAKQSHILAANYSNGEYFSGKAFAITETFAILTEQTFNDAVVMLQDVYAKENGNAG